MYAPLEKSDRRAIVMVEGAHNHPLPPPTKASIEGKLRYKEAARCLGTTGVTAGKVDSAITTAAVFNDQHPANFDPALGIARVKRKLTAEVKKEKYPFGTDLPGVHHARQRELLLPEDQRYIQSIVSHLGVDIIVTMLKPLADLVHSTSASYHDNTYKRLHGDWKEWECVIWNYRLNRRVTYARIYCKLETRQAFRLMFGALWDTVKKVTGRKVEFEFMVGRGLGVIGVDGCKPQVEGCGDDLVARVQSNSASLCKETDPQEIVKHIIRLCMIHLDAFFTKLGHHVSPEVLDRVRRFPYIRTQPEIDNFWTFCKESQYKMLRDWAADKSSYPWFIATVNEHFSYIPTRVWYNTDGHTNLNESAHPWINRQTGTNLTVYEAIESALKADSEVATLLSAAEETMFLSDSRNTEAHCLHNNRLRKESRARKAAQQVQAQNDLESIQTALDAELELRRESMTITKTLNEQKKTLTEAGVKRPGRRKGKGKMMIPLDPEPVQPTGPWQPSPLFPTASSSDFNRLDGPLPPELEPPVFDEPEDSIESFLQLHDLI